MRCSFESQFYGAIHTSVVCNAVKVTSPLTAVQVRKGNNKTHLVDQIYYNTMNQRHVI